MNNITPGQLKLSLKQTNKDRYTPIEFRSLISGEYIHYCSEILKYFIVSTAVDYLLSLGHGNYTLTYVPKRDKIGQKKL